MTIVHVDTANAAGSGSNPAGELNLPAGGFVAVGSSSPWSASGVVILYGDTNDADEGTYLEAESGSPDRTGDWINDTSEIDEWMVRLVSGQEFGSPGNNLTLYTGGGWTLGQSNWKAFGSGTGISGITVDTQIAFSCGWSYGGSGETILGSLEFAKGARGLLETFTNSNVNTGSDQITISGHGFNSGDGVVFKVSSGTPPSPLVANTIYYVNRVDANTIRLGTAMFNIDSTPSYVNITTTGSGSFSFTRIEADGSCNLEVDADD